MSNAGVNYKFKSLSENTTGRDELDAVKAN